MMTYSMRCAKCGLIQMAYPTCKSCSAKVGNQIAGLYQARVTMPEKRPDLLSPALGESFSPYQNKTAENHSRRLSFHGSGGSLFGTKMGNIVLSLVTLGIYSFWGRVRVRKYLMGQSQFEGDRFAYHGTGKELLIGFLKALIVFGVPISMLTVVRNLSDAGNLFKTVAAIAFFCIFMVLIPFATVAVRRYRLSRVSWRGIRFSFRGPAWDFIKLVIGGSLLTLLTLGLYYPIFMTKKHAFSVSYSYYGNERFHFVGQGGDLFGSYLLAILLTPFTLGLCWFWFSAKKQRYFWNQTAFSTAYFHSTVTGGRLLLLNLGNLLLLILTLGLGWAWVTVRNIRFTFNHLTFEQPLDITVTQQEILLVSPIGEGLENFFNLDASLELH